MERKTKLLKQALNLLNKNQKVVVVYKNTVIITISNRKMLTKLISKDYDEIEYVRWENTVIHVNYIFLNKKLVS